MASKENTDQFINQLNNLPNDILDRISNQIDLFNKVPTSKLTRRNVSELIDGLAYVFFMTPFKASTIKELWRSRPCKEGELFTHTDELRYPPSHCTSMLRMNFQGEPLFYSSDTPETTFAECRLQEQTFFHLTKYSVQPDNDFHAFCIGDIDNVRRKGSTVFSHPNRTKGIKDTLSRLRKDVALAVQLVDAFFVDRMNRKGESEYVVTSVIAKEFFNIHKGVDCLIFESVQHKGGFNYVFSTDAYDKYISPIETRLQLVTRAYGYGIYYTVSTKPINITKAPSSFSWPLKTDQYFSNLKNLADGSLKLNDPIEN